MKKQALLLLLVLLWPFAGRMEAAPLQEDPVLYKDISKIEHQLSTALLRITNNSF
ncbi:MAG: hypothetical protein ACYSUY_07315 [Planctomycetota bacterium]|jgi:hypothetical protein